MPVEDHAVHEKVREKAGAVYGCWGIPFDGITRYFAPHRIYNDDGTWINTQKEVVTEWSEGRKYDMADSDKKCKDCPLLPCGKENDEMVRRNGK